MSDFLRTVAKYSEAQPRWPEGTPIDPATGAGGGRWRSGDAPSLGAENVLEGYSEHAQINDKGWIVTSNVDDAVRALNEGRHVELMQVREVATLLDRLAAIALAAEELGKNAPVYDLCKVSVRGTNLFCADALDIERDKMPQFLAFPKPGSEADKLPRRPRGTVDAAPAFLEHLKRKGYTAVETTESASYLRASQRQLNGAKVGKAIRRMRDPHNPLNDSPPLIVSEDNYIIDGHHRWAAHVGIDSEDNNLGDVRMHIIRVNIRVIKLLEEANAFTEAFGMTRSALHKSWLALLKTWNEEDHPRGKTTPESTPGSFAPRMQGPAKLTVESWEYKRPSVRNTFALNVIYNPTYSELQRWAGREIKVARYLPLKDGGYVFWDAGEALHQQVAAALDQPFKLLDGGEGEVNQLHRNHPELFPVAKSWLSSVVQFFKEAADWVEAEHPRGKTTSESNAGSFRPKNSAQGELFVREDQIEQLESKLKWAMVDTIATKKPPAKVVAAATEYARLMALELAQDIVSGEDSHQWITADMLQDEAMIPMVEAYLIAEQREKALEPHSREVSELVRQDLAFGDDELKNANYEWATALDSYIGPGYNEINGFFRDDTDIEVDEDSEEFREYVSQFMSEEENEVLADAQEQYIAQNLNDWINEDERWTELNDRLAREEITQEEFQSELAELRTTITDEKSEEFHDSDYYTDAMSDLEDRAKSFARSVMEEQFRERVSLAEDHAREIKDLIDSRPPTPITLILRRGVKTGNSINWSTLKTGDTITFSGFTSTSSKREVADKFGHDNKVIEFVTPAGSKDVLFTTNDGEGEVILNHGVTAKVLHRSGGRLVVYLDPAGNGEDPEDEEVGKAERASYVMNFGRMHTEPVIVPKLRLLKRDWREEDHPRGKTTEDSTPGSFAPSAELRLRVHAMTSAKLGQLTPKYSKPYTIKVLKNPTQQDLKRWAGRDIDAIRFMVSVDGDVYVWNAEEAYHDQLQPAVGSMNTEFLSGGDSEDIALADLYPLIQAADERLQDKRWLKRGWKRPTKFLSQWLVTKAEWNEEDHPRGKTTPESNSGSFAPSGRSTGFVSPNVDEGVSFDEATARQSSERTRLLQSAAQEAAQFFGVAAHDQVGVGAWADGAEQSLIVSGDGDPEDFKAYMAFLGLIGEQKAVVDFTNDSSGPDTVFRLSVGNRPLKAVHEALLKAGVQFHTLRQSDHNVDVFVFAPGTEQETTDAVARAAQEFGGIGVAAIRGRGEFVGSWDTREEGRAAYEKILDTHGNRVHGHDRGWKTLRDRWWDRLQAVRKSWLQVVKEAVWREEDHPRGKSTPESTPGSFISVTSTPEFKEWFAGSKVVDAKGAPLRMYHGTYADFEMFSPVAGDYSFDIGHHFGTSVQAANIMRDKRRERDGGPMFETGAKILPVYLSIKNPLRIEDEDWTGQPLMLASQLHQAGVITQEELREVDPLRWSTPWREMHGDRKAHRQALLDVLSRKGYDGLVYTNNYEGAGDTWVAFYPEQVKSAFNARPSRDPHLMKSWLQIAKEAVWREEEHPRGKTTAESNQGSFAPAEFRTRSFLDYKRRKIEERARRVDSETDPVSRDYLMRSTWRDGQIRKIGPTAFGWIDVIKNPTHQEVQRFADRGMRLRYSIDFDSGNYAVWAAHAATHWEMERKLGVVGYGGGLSANNEDLISAGAVIEHIRHKVQYALKTKLIDDDQYDTLMEKLARVSKSSWLDTLLKYIPSQPRWPEGTPVDPETGAGGGRWAPSTEHAGYNFPKDAEGKPIKGEQWRDRNGNPVSPEIAARLKGIPPGYTDVVLNADPTAPCLAIAKDAKGREKRMFSAEWHEGRAKVKWERVRRFNQALPELRRKIEHALGTARGKDLIAAQVLYTLDLTGYRIGGNEDELADKEAFGITTITSSHVKVNGDKVSFSFPGKKGTPLSKTIEDQRLADIVRNAKADARRNQPIFDVSGSKVNSFLKELSGSDFIPHDFRSWNGTAMAIIEMGKWKTLPRTEKEMLKRQRVVLDKVGAWLGHQERATTKKSYIDPAVWSWWAT